MSEPRQDLGPKQLAWLRDKVANFEYCEAAAKAAEQHRREIERQVRERG